MRRTTVIKPVVFMIISFMVFAGCAHQPPEPEADRGKIYTAYNMWYQNNSRMYCINYQVGDILPVGTEIVDARIVREDDPYDMGAEYIYFRTAKTGRKFAVQYQKRFHPKRTIQDFFKLMFTEKTLDQLSEGMNKTELDAIKQGILVEGMSKEAVVVSVGYPPSHRTMSLTNNKWHYWSNRFRSKAICFNSDNKSQVCGRAGSGIL